MANVGFLVMLFSGLHYLNLERGWGDVWTNFSKIATAVGYFADHLSVQKLYSIDQQQMNDNSNKITCHNVDFTVIKTYK